MGLLLLLLLPAGTGVGDEDEIDLLIEALGAEEVERRETAMTTLSEMGEAIHPRLTAAYDHPDPEVRARARVLVGWGEWEPGAREAAGVGVSAPDCRPDSWKKKEFEDLAAAGKLDVILKADHEWLTCIIDGLLCDRKPVAQASLKLLHKLHQRRHSLPAGACSGGSLDLRQFRSAEARADEYCLWAQWWFTMAARKTVAGWSEVSGPHASGIPPEEGPRPAKEDWESILLRVRGGRFDDLDSCEARDLVRIRGMGEEAYPHIVRYLDHEDLELARSALGLLQALTGREERPLTEENKHDLRAEWLGWIHDNR